jgi:hypothetical protein
MHIDLRAEHLEIHIEQRPEQHRHRDKIEEEPRRRRKVLGSEGREPP